MRQALGKGLEALLGGAQLPQDGGNNSVQSIPVNKIVPNRYQPRKTFNEESLKELAQSIKQHGLTQPVVVVYDSGLDKYELVVGERRWRATQLAGLKEVQAIVHSKLDEKQLCALALIENIQRENLNPIETALGYRSLIQKFQVSQSELGEYCGKSKAAVSNTLRLLELPAVIQEALASVRITEGHGRAILMLSDEKKQILLLQKIITGKMSVRQAENASRALMMPAKEAKKVVKTPDVKAFEQSLQEALGAKVELRHGPKPSKGTLVLYYNSLEELDKLAERLKSKML
jgi:ParB family chromosome partitioning protein